MQASRLRPASPLRAKLAALEMEIEALKRGSDGGGSQTGSQHPAGDLAAALAAQTEALKEALAQRGGQIRSKLTSRGRR